MNAHLPATQGRTHSGDAILLVSNYPSDTGYAWWLMEEFWVAIANHFSKLGLKAFLAYPSIRQLSPRVTDAPIEPIEISVPGTNPLERKKALTFLRQNRIRIVYFTDRPWLSLDYIAMRRQGVTSVIIHDHTPGDRPPVQGLAGLTKALLHSLPWVNADRLFAVSPLMRERAIRNGRIPSSRCHVVQNGIRPQLASKSKDELRAELNLRPGSLVIISSGRAHPYKRFEFMIDTAALMRRRAPDLDFILLLVGDGPALPDLLQKVQGEELDGVVRLLGFRSDTADLLQAADIAMHASMGEGFSLSILEYMGAGLPVVVPSTPSVSQAITDNAEGLVFDHDSIDHAAEKLLLLANDSNLRHQLGSNARTKVATHFTLAGCIQQLTTHLEKLYPSTASL